MEAQHEEADVLHEQRDEPEEDARADGDEGVAPHGQHVLLDAYLSQPRRMADSDLTTMRHTACLNHFWEFGISPAKNKQWA